MEAREFTPENEYYIGRTISANILGKYDVYENAGATRYINLVGQSLALASDKPEVYAGYHFIILDTDEVNAFAAPGGFVMVTRGLLRCCKNEDCVAAVLAHEIGHMQLDHNMKAISGSRKTALFKVVGTEVAKHYAGEQLGQVVEVFEGTIGDIMSTLVDKGYARKQEYAADEAAIEIMKRVGYNPVALKDMLAEMTKALGHESGGFGKTHPKPSDRISELEADIKGFGPVQSPNARQVRFKQQLANI